MLNGQPSRQLQDFLCPSFGPDSVLDLYKSSKNGGGCKTYSSIEKCSIAPWVSILWCTTLVLPRSLLLREITSEKVNSKVSKEVLSAPETPWNLDWSCLTACFTSSLWDWGCGLTPSRAADSRGVLNGCNTPSFSSRYTVTRAWEGLVPSPGSSHH